jgi:hypothetical protein
MPRRLAATRPVMCVSLAATMSMLAGISPGTGLAQEPSTSSSTGAPAKRWTDPAGAYKPRRTSWGDPDLRGTWPLDAVGQTPMQRPERFGDRAMMTDEEYAAAQKRASDAAALADKEDAANKLGIGHWSERGRTLRQTSLITYPANGRIPPPTPLGSQRAAAMKSSWSQKEFDELSDFNSLDRCISRGMPASMVPFPYNNGLRIFQAPGYVVINMEMIHETRIIPLDGRPAMPGQMRQWLGDSHGRFLGNTLEIETTNFNGETPMVIVGPTNKPVPTSRAMRIVEHLTPTGADSIYYEAWVEDPENLTGPWKMEFPWTRNEKYQLFEYACHEGNTLIPGYIRSTSPRFAAARKAATGK